MLNAIEMGQLDEAKKDFAWALRQDDDEVLFSLAEQLYALGFLQQAQRTYLKLLDRYPDEDELRTALAEIAIDNGNNDEALAYLAQIKPDSDAYLQSLLVAADLYQTEEQFEVTEEKLQTAYQIAPDEPAVLFALGEYYYSTGRFELAIRYYFALIQAGVAEFARVDIAGRLGMAYAQSGKFDQALGYLKQVAPGFMTADIRFQTGLTQLNLGQLKEAIITLKELIDEDRQYASAYPALAQAYRKENHLSQALKTAQEGLGVDEYNENLFTLAADIAGRLGEFDLVKKYLQTAHKLAPENLAISLKLSNYYLSQGDHAANIDLLQGIEKDSVDPQVEWNLAQSYQAQETFDQAAQAFENARPTYWDNPTFLKQLIHFYQESGEHDLLMDTLDHALTLTPDDPELNELDGQLRDF
ncbi:MAG TPA: tetratricopeptide repeat protein [Candidatus Limosilactobacillus faecipullorum]|nr:tetratricopeptide repeat protein [Candidatus Limosilactobacillus faecipullorum]